jgi:hypothetical protein
VPIYLKLKLNSSCFVMCLRSLRKILIGKDQDLLVCDTPEIKNKKLIY